MEGSGGKARYGLVLGRWLVWASVARHGLVLQGMGQVSVASYGLV